MLELGNLEYMLPPWRLECARKFMKKHEFLRSVYENKAAQFLKNCYLKNILSTFSISMYILATEL